MSSAGDRALVRHDHSSVLPSSFRQRVSMVDKPDGRTAVSTQAVFADHHELTPRRIFRYRLPATGDTTRPARLLGERNPARGSRIFPASTFSAAGRFLYVAASDPDRCAQERWASFARSSVSN